MPELRIFTIGELRRCDGEDLPMCVAHNGIVYDVSASSRWKQGLHENLHFPGQDLTFAIVDAPHGDEVFKHPEIIIVGRLERSKSDLEEEQ